MSARRSTGPPDDLTAFYAEEHDRVRRALVLFTGDRRLAEELSQDAFVKTCQHWERVRTMESPGAWVHRVGINLAISRARRRRTELGVVGRLRGERRSDVADPIEALPDPALHDALAALPIDERAVVVLRFVADLSVAEVAASLRVPEGTVKTRTKRALARLRESGIVGGGGEADADGSGAVGDRRRSLAASERATAGGRGADLVADGEEP